MEWFFSHFAEVVAIYLLIIQVLTKLEELIPDDKDVWLRKTIDLLKKIALLVPSKKN